MRDWIEGIGRLLLVVLVIALPFMLGGLVVAGIGGLLGGLAIALVIEGIAWLVARPVIVRICDATLVDVADRPELLETVDRLSAAAGVRAPRIAVSSLPIPNAMAAVTPGGGLICVTEGLIGMLSAAELEAVLAHEIAHLTQPGRSAATLAALFAAIPGAITAAAGSDLYFEAPYRRGRLRVWGGWWWGVGREAIARLTAPLAAILVRLSTPVRGEFVADARAGEMTGAPVTLATALRKLQSLAGRIVWPVNPAIAHLLVIHPFGCPRLGQLFNTHPPTPERLAALAER
jgi:heat shock protein HtpX